MSAPLENLHLPTFTTMERALLLSQAHFYQEQRDRVQAMLEDLQKQAQDLREECQSLEASIQELEAQALERIQEVRLSSATHHCAVFRLISNKVQNLQAPPQGIAAGLSTTTNETAFPDPSRDSNNSASRTQREMILHQVSTRSCKATNAQD